jgi:heat shock protein HtpX
MSGSLAIRAVLAIVLMVGFYLLAIGLALLLFAIPVLEVKVGNRIHPKLALLCIVGGLGILWSILPRFDSFEAPGPRLTRKAHPRLFETLEALAKEVREPMPAEVYLVPDVNAFVTSRGGVMGFGSRRVMGVGLPLLQLLTVEEMKGVLGHELGHFKGGDVALGPWVYKTRGAIGRTLETFGDSVLQYPFKAYGYLFLMVTSAISRRQELDADALAASVVGPKAFASGLKKTHGGAPAFDAFMNLEYLPALSSGFRPPLAAGFGMFLRAEAVSKAVNDGVQAELKHGKGSIYDTHPPLKERLKNLADLPPREKGPRSPSAVTLLEDVERLEQELLALLFGPKARALSAVAWTELGDKVLVPQWREALREVGKKLAGVTPASLPEHVERLQDLVERKQEGGPPLGREEARERAKGVVGSALVVALADAGWTIAAPPGEPLVATRGGSSLQPNALLEQLVKGELDADAWRRTWADAGIAAVELVPGAKAEEPKRATKTRRRPTGA